MATSTARILPASQQELAEPHAEAIDARWKGLYKVGGVAALLVVLAGLIEMIITFFPGGEYVT